MNKQRQLEFRLVEKYSGHWLVQSRMTTETWKIYYPTVPYPDVDDETAWHYENIFKKYADATEFVNEEMRKQTFVGRVLYPPFPEEEPLSLDKKPWWTLW